MTTKLTRKGRPPKVNIGEDGTVSVTVKGTHFAFRNGRPVGANYQVRGEEYEYAKALVARATGVTGE